MDDYNQGVFEALKWVSKLLHESGDARFVLRHVDDSIYKMEKGAVWKLRERLDMFID